MSSSELRDRARPVILSPLEFEVVFQVAHLLSNFQDSRLEALGCTRDDLDLLLMTLGSIRDQAATSSRVRIDFDDESAPQAVEEAGGHIIGSEVRGVLPRRFASIWSPLAELVVTALSPRELFLRIGYSIDETRDAIAKLGGSEE